MIVFSTGTNVLKNGANALKRVHCTSLLFLSVSLIPLSASGQMPAWEPDLVPSGANVGECYARVEIPAQYATSSENVLVEDGYSKLEVRQPRLASRQEQVLVKEASVRYEVRQPRYKTISAQVMVRPSYNRLSVTPPQFRTVTETIQTSATRLVWKRGNPTKLRAQGYIVHSTADDRASRYAQGGNLGGNIGNGNASSQLVNRLPATHCGATCEIWCLVEEPGESTSFNRKVMTSPGEIRRTNVPAKFQSVSKQVVADPGGVREIPIEAQYRSITVEDVMDPGSERRVNIPPKYGVVNKRTLTQPGRYEWRRVVCAPGTLNKGMLNKGTLNGTHNSSHISSSPAPGYSSGRYSSGSYGSSNSAPITYGVNGIYGSGSTSNYGARNTVSSSATSRTIAGQTVQGGTYYYGTNKPVYPNGR